MYAAQELYGIISRKHFLGSLVVRRAESARLTAEGQQEDVAEVLASGSVQVVLAASVILLSAAFYRAACETGGAAV